MSVNNSHMVDIPRVDWQDRDFMNALFKWDERFPNFKPQELACKCCGDLRVNWKALEGLQYLRGQLWKSPLKINSAYRCPKHNAAVGGAKNSLHMQGRAYDIYCQPWAGKTVASFIYYAAVGGVFRGIGLYSNFIHIDTGPHRTWESGDVNLDPEDRNDPHELE